MTTVIVTSNAVACDHQVVDKTIPNTISINKKHMKFFVSPTKKFVVAAEGTFDPDDLKRNDFLEICRLLIGCIVDATSSGDVQAEFIDKDRVIVWKSVIDQSTVVLLVIKDATFSVVSSVRNEDKLLIVKTALPAGLGTGGFIAEGLLEAGIPIEDIWKDLSEMDLFTSVEHTIFYTDKLKDWKTA